MSTEATPTLEPPKTDNRKELSDDVSFLSEFVSGETSRSTDNKVEKKADETKPAETPAAATTPEAEPKAEDTAKTKKAKPAAATAPLPPQPAPVDYEKIAEASGRGAAAALSKAAEKKAPEVTELMEEEERERYAVIQRMEKDFPKEAGKAKEYAESIQRSVAYQKTWEKDNPGKAFDPKASEHDAFYEKNDVEIDDHLYTKAAIRIEAERLFEKQDSKESKRLAELEAKDKVREAEPLIAAAAAHARQSYYGMAGEEFAKVIDANGNVDNAELKRIVDADPGKAVVIQAASSVPLFAADLHKLTNGLESFDDKNPKHRFIADFAERQQQTLKAMTPAEQSELAAKLNRKDVNGAAFVTAEEFNAMTPAQQARSWRLNEPDLALLYAAEQVAMAQKSVADEETRLESFAKARGYQKVGGAQTPPVTPATPSETPPESRPRATSPAATVAPMNAHAAGETVGPEKNHTDSFLSDWLR